MIELQSILAPDFLLRNSLYAGCVVGLTCPLVGVYFIMRRMIFLGVALPQISSAGIALAFFLHGLGVHFLPHEPEEHWMVLVGALVLTASALLLLALLERRARGGTEARIGVAYVLASAASILLIAASPHGEAHVLSLFKGEIVAVSDQNLGILLAGYTLVVVALIACYRELLLVSYDRDMAIALGRRSGAWDVALFAIIGLTIALGVMTVGPLVVFAMLLLPPLAALRLVRGMIHISVLAAVIGVASALLGFYVSFRYDLPLGPTDAVVAGCAFGVALVAARRVRGLRG